MYFDEQQCRVCGAGVELQSHDSTAPRASKDPDGTVDVRVCTNPECPTNQPDRPDDEMRP